jgi:alpha-beta hydrolase superfamily lysophospholipase
MHTALLAPAPPLASAQGPPIAVYTHVPTPPVVGVVVFLHGFGMHARMARYEPLYAACSRAELAVVAWDMPHFGASSRLGTPGHAWRHGRDLDGDALASDALSLAARARSCVPGAPLVLIGESLGGALATRIAPSVRPDALVCVAGVVPHRTRLVWARVNAALALAVARAHPVGRAEALRDPLVRAAPVPPSGVRAGLRLLATSAPEEVRSPVLHVCGGRDPVAPWRRAKAALSAFIRSPRRALRVLPDSAHDVIEAAVGPVVAFAREACE